MKMKSLVVTLVLLAALKSQTPNPYIGGNQFNNYYTNPNLINSLLSQVNTTVPPQCDSIPGIGQPILSIKKVLQTVDASLDCTNQDTSAKIIFFREKKNTTTYQTSYKMVVMVKTFSATTYIGIEGIYKQIGFPTFEVITYYVDSNIDNVRNVLNEYLIDPNGFVGCGDIKAIYCQANSALPNPDKMIKGIETDPHRTPYAQGNKLINEAPKNQDNKKIDPDLLAEIIKLLQKP